MENTLGAPTEGLGATVTFAGGDRVGAPAAKPGPTSGGVMSGVAGPGAHFNPGRMVQAEQQPGVLDAFMALAGGAAKGKLAEARMEQYVVGMQRAAAGEALLDIKEEQPWYSRMFGDDSVTEGARWYESHSRATSVANGIDDDMGSLRELSPDQAVGEFQRRAVAGLSGDAQADAATLQSLTQMLPLAMKRHAKEHRGFLNERAAAAFSANLQTQAARLQHIAKGAAAGMYSADDLRAALSGYVGTRQRPKDMDEKTFRDLTLNGLMHAAQQQNFHGISALRTTAFFDTLPPEDRDKFDAATITAMTKARARFSERYADDLARVRTMSETTPEGESAESFVLPKIEMLEAKWRTEVGAREPFFSGDQRAALLSNSATSVIRAREREADRAWQAAQSAAARQGAEGRKAAEESGQMAVIQDAIFQGGIQYVKTLPGMSQDKVDRVAMDMWAASKDDVSGQAKLLKALHEQGEYIRPLQRNLEGQVNKALAEAEKGNPDGLLGVYDRWKVFREEGGSGVADYLAGSHAQRLEAMYQSIEKVGASRADGAFGALTFAEKRERLSKDDVKTAKKVAAKVLAPAWFGTRTDLNESSSNWLLNQIEPQVQKWVGQGVSADEAVRRVLKAPANKDIQTLGGFAWRKASGQSSIVDYLTRTEGADGQGAIGADKIGDVFYDAVDELLNGKDGKYGIMDNPAVVTSIRQLQDEGGIPQFQVSVITEDGDLRQGRLSGNDVFTKWREKTRKSPPMSRKQAEPMAGKPRTWTYGGSSQSLFAPGKLN